MTLAHIMWGLGGVSVGILITLYITEKPFRSKDDDIEALLKKKKK